MLLAWAAVPLLLQLFTAKTRRLVHRRGLRLALVHTLANLAQAAACTAEAVLVTLLIARLPAPVATPLLAVLFAGAQLFLLVDAWMFTASGLRLELLFVRHLGQAHLFAQGPAFRFQVVGLGLATLGCIAGAFAYVPSQLPLWTAVDLGVPGAGVACGLAVALGTWRWLPAALVGEWNHRFFAMQVHGATALAAHIAPRRPGAPWPQVLTARAETSTPLDPKYPLWRDTQAFVGAPAFPWTTPDKPHVVCLFLESFRAHDVGVLGGAHPVTPHFDALSREGVLWRNFYASGTTTARAAVAALYGIPPAFSEPSTQAEKAPPPLRGLPHLLNERGYLSAFFHNGTNEWENARHFYLTHGFFAAFDEDTLKMKYPESRGGRWGLYDEYLLRFHAEWLAAKDQAGVPTFSTLFTITNHTPWEVPEAAAEPPVTVEKSTPYYRFLRSMLYTDACLGQYVAALRRTGLDKKTVLLVLADTGQDVDADDANRLLYSGELNEPGMRVPLLLLAPGCLGSPAVRDEIGSQVDLLPTLMDLLALTGPHHGTGTSLYRDVPDRQALLTHVNPPAFMGLRRAQHRFNHTFASGTSQLLDLRQDRLRPADVSASAPAETAAYRAEVVAARAHLDHLYRHRAFMPPVAAPTPEGPRIYRAGVEPRPEGYPESLADMRARIDALGAAKNPAPFVTRELNALRVALTTPVSDADKLLLAQLRYKKMRHGDFGAFTTWEAAAWERLSRQVDAAQARAVQAALGDKA